MRIFGAMLAMAVATPAAAAVTASAPDGFISRNEVVVPVAPEAAWTALIAWHRWWPKAHSYSGTPPRLVASAGGGLVERWPGGEVLHATVVNMLPPGLLRLSGGFGPLQAMPVSAVLDFQLAAAGKGTRITMVYRVAGSATAKLDELAGPVDSVLAEGLARLARFAGTGAPE
jgi:Polyketide cyclase / dehydrase and lipid transport